MKKTIYSYHSGRLSAGEAAVVREFPLRLIVNGRDLATLIVSPHDLRFLVAGFLRVNGFVRTVDDFEMLSVCTDMSTANVRVKGDIPEKLKPVLTSGCGTGITFTLPGSDLPARKGVSEVGTITPADLFSLMEELARRAEQYRTHGGIHSAAVGEGGKIHFYAEDLGRHNTVDRLAGESLLKGVDLAGKTLVTSGRISSEMVAKAAHLGIAAIASRTSPTDMAVRLADERGITVVGYVRGGKFIVYSHPERLDCTISGRIQGVTGVILAGGTSRRMGSDKALLPYRGGLFIETVYRQMAALFPEVLVVTGTPEQYPFLPCRQVADLVPGGGVLAGVHSGLVHATHPAIFVVACDMPFLDDALIRHLVSRAEGADVVLPLSDSGAEPLHALYARSCLPAVEASLGRGERRIVSFFPEVHVREIPQEEIAAIDPGFASFHNINTPEEYSRLRGDDPRQEEPTGEPR
jgi:FdhD protein